MNVFHSKFPNIEDGVLFFDIVMGMGFKRSYRLILFATGGHSNSSLQ